MAEILPLPKYQQVYLVLRQRLADGEYDAGLPGEMSLTKEFGMSRVTVRRALDVLARERLIARSRHIGTRRVASGPAGSDDIDITTHTAWETTSADRLLEQEVVPASPALAASLQIAEGDGVQRTVRVRATAAGPACYIVSWAVLAKPPTSRSWTRKRGTDSPPSKQAATATQRISARHADLLIAQHLEVPVGQSVLVMEQVSLDARGKVVGQQRIVCRPDRLGLCLQTGAAATGSAG